MYENPQNIHKNAQESSETFKPGIHNVVVLGQILPKDMASFVPIGCVGFTRYCGKIYSRHFFLYDGFKFLPPKKRGF